MSEETCVPKRCSTADPDVIHWQSETCLLWPSERASEGHLLVGWDGPAAAAET
jgi:hypothetical protein